MDLFEIISYTIQLPGPTAMWFPMYLYLLTLYIETQGLRVRAFVPTHACHY